MAILYIVNHADTLADCLRVATDGDTVLLIEDGVYAARVDHATGSRMVALDDDVAARGLTQRLTANVAVVGYDGFVELVCQHQPIVTWPG